MADTIERTIYKLEIDDSGYIRGVENMSASTRRFSEVQAASNKALQVLETALKEQSAELEKSKRALDAYTGADEKYRQQLQKTYNDQKAQNQNLVGLVSQARQEYEKATKAAQDFANTSARANNLQPQPGARIAPQQPSQAAGISAQIFNTIDLTDMAELAEITAKTKVEFDELADSIQLAEERLKQLDPASEEFKELAPIVEQGNKALQDYRQAAEGAADSSGSLRSQIRLGREELVKLEAQGKGNTKEYFELEKRVAKLTDAFGDQQQRIKILASDTKLLDFGKGAITAATSAFSAYTSVSILAGNQSEELQKKTMQLFAAMQLLQSLEQLSNLTRREGVLATLAQSAAQSAYTAVVGASTGALRVFRLALAATGIGAAIAAITFLVQRFNELQEAEEKAALAQKTLLDINKQAVEGYAKEVTSLKLLAAEHNNTATSLKRKKEIQDELQEQYPSYFANLDKQADKEAFIAEQVEKVTQALIIQSKVQAAQGLLSQKFSDLLKQQFDPTEAVDFTDKLRAGFNNLLGTAGDFGLDLAKTSKENISKAEKDYNDFEKFIIDFVNKSNSELEKLGGDPKATGAKSTSSKAVENVFAQKLKELQAKLAEVTAKSFESEGTIRKQFEASLAKEIASLNQLVKDKKLTQDQAAILIELTARINDVQLNEALNDFNKKVTDARNKLNEELRDLQRQNTEESIQLLQDEFERRRQLIDFNEKQLTEDAIQQTAERLTALEEQRDLIGEEQYQQAKNRIVQAGEDEQTNILIRAAQERQQLAVDSVKQILEKYEDIIFNSKLISDKAALADIQALSESFKIGKINYEQFKKDLAAIQKRYEDAQLQNTIDTLESEIRELRRKINNTLNITGEQYDDLIKLVKQKEAELTAAKTKQAIATPSEEEGISKDIFGDDVTEAAQKRLQQIDFIQGKLQQLASDVISFWQITNQAEAEALDRSIALQEKRVDAALRIAERGNAQYLKAETDRLRELEVARENAARRQLGIDAALQASQILVGITGAIAKIATPGIGIAETIGSIAVIVGSLATGFALVKSLQGNQPRLFVGTKDTGPGGKEDNKGGFRAILHPHEAVIPADKNKAYKPAVEAIYDGRIPPEALNNFVKNYHSIKPVALPNYQRIKEAAEINVSHDSRIAVAMSEHSTLLKENNELQREILRKKIHVENKIDKDGVSSMVYEYLEQKRIASKT